jgi:hypothetical protein
MRRQIGTPQYGADHRKSSSNSSLWQQRPCLRSCCCAEVPCCSDCASGSTSNPVAPWLSGLSTNKDHFDPKWMPAKGLEEDCEMRFSQPVSCEWRSHRKCGARTKNTKTNTASQLSASYQHTSGWTGVSRPLLQAANFVVDFSRRVSGEELP